MLKVCIASEGNRDKEVLEVLIRRVFNELRIDVEILTIAVSNTGIIGYMRSFLSYFFNSLETDIAIFITDQDLPRKRDNRERHIISEINRFNPSLLSRCIVGIPNPHLEKWLVSDQVALVKFFHLRGDTPIPFSDCLPKEQISRLRTNMETMISEVETYISLAKNVSVNNIVRRDKDFKKFIDSIKEKCRNC